MGCGTALTGQLSGNIAVGNAGNAYFTGLYFGGGLVGQALVQGRHDCGKQRSGVFSALGIGYQGLISVRADPDGTGIVAGKAGEEHTAHFGVCSCFAVNGLSGNARPGSAAIYYRIQQIDQLPGGAFGKYPMGILLGEHIYDNVAVFIL